ncbi:MAG: hypothetical protein IPH44_38730 [Myxococcales bacterium]|nr:hypothetical protein [Myxococcales bacterium]
MIAEHSPSLRDLVPVGAMQGAQQTSLTTKPVRWAVDLYYGPEHGGGLWARARDVVMAVGRPIAKRLAIPAVVELFRLGIAIARLDELIRPHVRSSYHRDDLDMIASDAAIEHAHQALLAQVARALKTLPATARTSKQHTVFPRDVMRDATVAQRVSHASHLLEEVSASLDELGLAVEVSDPGDGPPADPCPWAYDPAVPTAIARRLMAGRRIAFAPHLVRLARGTWSVQAQRQAALDWADDVDDLAGLLGALPGFHISSLPLSARLDIDAVLADQAMVDTARAAHLTAATEAIQAG